VLFSSLMYCARGRVRVIHALSHSRSHVGLHKRSRAGESSHGFFCALPSGVSFLFFLSFFFFTKFPPRTSVSYPRDAMHHHHPRHPLSNAWPPSSEPRLHACFFPSDKKKETPSSSSSSSLPLAKVPGRNTYGRREENGRTEKRKPRGPRTRTQVWPAQGRNMGET
jgi:hypothetical protein